MNNLAIKKDYDLAEITRVLLSIRKDLHEEEKCQAINDAIDLINNPSVLNRITKH